ncbi:hypothetical protein CBD41_04830 [bacterium TMED181]|nr:hypothetical protein [Planctomycetota bacterium]OUW44909.1 MAG: hypothetical protein CBD41_04830 [bacterium TMED181]
MSEHHDSPLIDRPQLALRRIRQLRARRRWMRTVTGTLRWFTLASAAVWLSFLLDWIAVLPVPLRMVQGAFWVGLLLLAFRAIFLAVRVPARESELAAMVEQSSRELEDSLITAVQLTDPDNPRRHYYNPDMIRRTVELAEEKVANLKPGQFLTWSRARRTFLLWLLLLVPAILAVEHRPGLVSSFIARNVYFENQPWPQNYELVILQPENPVMTLAKGSALVVDIRKDRGGNARGFLEVFFPETQDRSSIQEEIGLDRKGEDGFRHVFQNLQRDLEFRAHCGDYTSQWYRIQVRARPRIEELELYYEFPEYTGLLSDSENPAVRSGHVKAPVGTIVTYRARVSLPLASAVRVESRPSGDGEELIRQPLTPGADNILEGSFPAEVDSRWWFELESQEKFVNENPITWRIAVIPDRAPEVLVEVPGQNIEVTPRAMMEVSVLLRDDYAVESGAIIFEPEIEEEGSSSRRTIALDNLQVDPENRKNSSEALTIDLDSWDLKPGERWKYRAEARDAMGQIGISRTWILSVLSQEELERVTQDELTLLRERLEETLTVQRDVRRELEDLSEALTMGKNPGDQAPIARQARTGQDRVSTRIEDAAERLETISSRLLRNRMSDAEELDWIQNLTENLDQISKESMTPVRQRLDELARRTAQGEVGVEEAEEAIFEVRQVESQLGAVVSDLQEWGDMRTMIRKVEELIRTEKDLEDRIEERVRQLLGGEAESEGGD